MTFTYLSVFVSIVLGIAVVQLLRGLVSFFTTEGIKAYWLHVLWMLHFVLWLPFFWWYTLNWAAVVEWTFFEFLFLVGFSMIVFAAIAVLVPDSVTDATDFKEYYYRTRRSFFVLMAFMTFFDALDTVLKGPENLERLGGASYFIGSGVFILGHLYAGRTRNSRYHAFWALFFITIYYYASFTSGDILTHPN